MKKAIFMALIILVGATFTASANDNKDGKKKKKGAAQPATEEVIVLETTPDSISYALGMASARGLIQYLKTTYDFDTLFMDDFKRGFADAIDHNGDPKYVAYNAGVQIATQVQRQFYPREMQFFEAAGDSLEADKFYRGFIDGAQNDTTFFNSDRAMKYAEEQKGAITKRMNEAYDAENIAFLEENKTKEGVVTLPSGLQYKVIKQGEGPIATDSTDVTVRYEGKMIDGTVFDSSYGRHPDTAKFKPNKLIKGWTEALKMMPEGSIWELYIPKELAYGEQQAGNIRPYSTIIFTVEVVKVEE